MRKLTVLSLILLVGTHARADLLPRGARTIPRCASIENRAEYSDWVLVVAHGPPRAEWTGVGAGDCVTVDGKYHHFTLFAAPRDRVDLDSIPDWAEPGFFEEHTAFHRVEGNVRGPDWVRNDDPRARIVHRLRLEGGDRPERVLKRAVVYHFRDGSDEEVAYRGEEIPPPSRDVPPIPSFDDQDDGFGVDDWAWYVGAPAVAILAIFALVILRRRA